MEGYDYDAAASSVKIEEIAADEDNQEILRGLKENDSDFDKLVVTNECYDYYNYCPEGPPTRDGLDIT